MQTTMAVEPHSSAMRRTIAAAPRVPRPSPPASGELRAPSRPAPASARMDFSGKAPLRSTASALGAIVSEQIFSSDWRWVSGIAVIVTSFRCWSTARRGATHPGLTVGRRSRARSRRAKPEFNCDGSCSSYRFVSLAIWGIHGGRALSGRFKLRTQQWPGVPAGPSAGAPVCRFYR